MTRFHRILIIGVMLAAAAAGCASSNKANQRITVESAGVPHTGYYDSHGLWHGGSYDDHHIYHEDDPDWGKRNDPEWSAHFH